MAKCCALLISLVRLTKKDTLLSLSLSFYLFYSTPRRFDDSPGESPAHHVIIWSSQRTAQEQHITLSDVIAALIIMLLAQTSPVESTTQFED